MPECPVCRTRYVKGRLDRCHVCGWQFDASGFSMIGPVKIEHQLSGLALTKIQAWAHHMWTTIQQQKERIVELQAQLRQLRQLQNQTPTPQSLPAAVSNTTQITPTPNEAPTPTAAPSSEMWQWVLTRLEQAEQERSHLKEQVAQLQAQPSPPVLTGSSPKPEIYTEMIKWREESQAKLYQQSEQWQDIFEHFRYNIQQAVLQQEQKIQTAIAPLETQMQSQQLAIAQLEVQLKAALTNPELPIEDVITQLEELKNNQGEVANQLALQKTTLKQLAQMPEMVRSLQDWVEQQQQTLDLNGSSPLNHFSPLTESIAALETQIQSLEAAQDSSLHHLTHQIQELQQAQTQLTNQPDAQALEVALQQLQTQLNHIQTQQQQTLNLPEEMKGLEKLLQQQRHQLQTELIQKLQTVEGNERISLSKMEENLKNEMLAKLARFDTIYEQFHTLESTVVQLQHVVQALTRSSSAAARRTNTVYTRYQ